MPISEHATDRAVVLYVSPIVLNHYRSDTSVNHNIAKLIQEITRCSTDFRIFTLYIINN